METYIEQFIKRITYNRMCIQQVEHTKNTYRRVIVTLIRLLEALVVVSTLMLAYDMIIRKIVNIFVFDNFKKYLVCIGIFVLMCIPTYVFSKKFVKVASTNLILNTDSIENITYAENLIKSNLDNISNVVVKSVYDHSYAFIDIANKIYSVDLDKCQLDMIPSDDNQWHFARKNDQLSVVTYPSFE